MLNNNGDFEGFNVVLGNPPYIQLSKTVDITEAYKSYLIKTYNTSGGRLNTYIFFIHQGYNILKNSGELAYIIPNTILTQEYYKFTREFLLRNTKLHTIVNYDELPFESAIVEVVSILFKKEINLSYEVSSIELDKVSVKELNNKNNNDFFKEANTSFSFNTNNIISKSFINSKKLEIFTEINQAIALKGDKKLSLMENNVSGLYYKLLDGRNINKYTIKWTGVYLDFNLERIHSCKRKDIFESSEKLFFRRVSANLIFTYDDAQYYALNTIVVVNSKPTSNLSLKFLLATLNSKLLNYIYINKFKSTKTVFSEIQANTVGQLPIKDIPESAQQPFITLVDQILAAKQAGEDTSVLEGRIDELVYALYGLTEEEIAVVSA